MDSRPFQVWDFSPPASGFLLEVIPGISGEAFVKLLPFPLSVECGSWVVPRGWVFMGPLEPCAYFLTLPPGEEGSGVMASRWRRFWKGGPLASQGWISQRQSGEQSPGLRLRAQCGVRGAMGQLNWSQRAHPLNLLLRLISEPTGDLCLVSLSSVQIRKGYVPAKY